jgi:hypothetical protein
LRKKSEKVLARYKETTNSCQSDFNHHHNPLEGILYARQPFELSFPELTFHVSNSNVTLQQLHQYMTTPLKSPHRFLTGQTGEELTPSYLKRLSDDLVQLSIKLY